MTDESFLAAFEACIAMRDGVRRFARHLGKPDLYNETITVAFLSLLNERKGWSPSASWKDLLRAYPELTDRALLGRYYDAETLNSAAARGAFFMARCGVDAAGPATRS